MYLQNESLAPIVLFVFARPHHTRRTLELLARNALAKQSLLYIFADGLPKDASLEKIKSICEVRDIIRLKKWCGRVEIFESGVNRGLAASILRGVQFATKRHGRAIVLEDDLETSSGFLTYMNDALDTYEKDRRVMQVSGFNVKTKRWAPETGFLRVSTSWGWATWDRAWQFYNNDAAALLEQIRPRREQFDLDGCSFHFEELERNVNGDLETWAVRWYASIFLNNGLCLYPRKSLVRNIGFDGTGENCKGVSSEMTTMSKARGIAVRRVGIFESAPYLEAHKRYHLRSWREWTKSRFRDRLWHRVGRLFPID